MGYVEEIQKINSLARELLKHGRVNSLDEAVVKAREMLKTDIDFVGQKGAAIAKPEETRIENPNAESQYMRGTVTGNYSQEHTQGSDSGWQQAMAKNNDYIIKMLKKFEIQINELNGEIASMKSEVKNVRDGQRVSSSSGNERREEQKVLKQMKEDTRADKFSSKANHPKVGDSDPKDFAVEKIFYCGNK